MMWHKFIQSENSNAEFIPSGGYIDGDIPVGSFDVFGFVSSLFGNNQAVTGSGVLGILAILWSIYTFLAYLVAIIFLVLYVYASIRKVYYQELLTEGLRHEEKLYNEKFRGAARGNRLGDIYKHSESDNPNDWKLAIIEADVVLDDILKKKGYPGGSLGERLKSISSGQLSTLNDAWEAHKIRNQIAHGGADFVLTKRIASETIMRYQRVFEEFGEV